MNGGVGTSSVDVHALVGRIKARARELGFDLVGIAPAGESKYREYLRKWLDDGRAGSMEWLARRFEERVDPGVYLPGARSVICLAGNYYLPLKAEDTGGAPVPQLSPLASPGVAGAGERAPATGGTPVPQGRVARYALGADYHEVFKPRLHAMADFLRAIAPEARTRAAVDTAPVMEKELAARAGIGWMGKNTCLINPQIGSWLLLGEVITTLELPADEPGVDRCGTCRRCIEACPTGAITAPYELDARRCISYLTIEHRGEMPAEFADELHGWLYGCDICQEVCPWNSKAPATADPAFAPRFEGGRITLADVLSWDEQQYRTRLRGSAMKRVKLPVLQRNARLLEASDKSVRPTVSDLR